MSSDAVQMNQELLQLVRGKAPTTSEWRTEVPTDYSFRGSRNKPLVCKTAEAFHGYLAGNPGMTLRALDWWVGFCRLPLSAGEELTPEEVYRSMMVYAAFAAGALARKVGHAEAEAACLANARAHVAFLALGAGGGSGKTVTNHHLDKIGAPCILVGDGPFKTHLPYVAQAGLRGWIRNRDGGPQTFHFAEHIGLSVILGQAAGLGFERNLAPWQVDLFNSTIAFRPDTPPLGLAPADRTALAGFLGAPESATRAAQIVAMASNCPEVGFEFVRHDDAAVETYMLENHASSTDDLMVDAWRAGGETAKASADDGLRSSHLRMTAREDGAGNIVVEGGGRSVSVAMSPRPITWRASVRAGRISLHQPNTSPTPAPAPAPPPDPTRPSTQRGHRRQW